MAVVGAAYSKEVGIVLSLAAVALVLLVMVPASKHMDGVETAKAGPAIIRPIVSALWQFAPGTAKYIARS